MMTRRRFLSSALAASGAAALPGCAGHAYDEAVQATWRHTEAVQPKNAALMRELVRQATLAPSSHNTQCWRFELEEKSLSILPDLDRRCPVVDPDDHHLFVSLGCATENLAQAALAHGLMAHVAFNADGLEVAIGLEPTKALASPLYEAITQRQSTRADYDGQPLSSEDLHLLERAGTGEGVDVLILTAKESMEGVLEHVIEGNTAQMNDPAFIKELKDWIRFSKSEAVRKGDGLFTGSSGNPSVPRWLGSPLFDLFFTVKNETDKYASHVRSSAGIAVFSSQPNDAAQWIEVGRCYERFALQAAALGIRNAHLNQPVELETLRPQFARFLGLGDRRPDLVVRFGRGPTTPPSLRRPVQAVLTSPYD